MSSSSSSNKRSNSVSRNAKIVPSIEADGVAKPQQVKIHSDKFMDHLRSSPGLPGAVGEPISSESMDVEVNTGSSENLDVGGSGRSADALLEEYKVEINQLTTTEDDDIEEPKLRAEYAIWKKNANYLYDLMITTRVAWPSLTVEWLPDIEQLDGNVKRHKLLLGTQTSGNENEYLRIGTIDLPESDGNKEADSASNNKPSDVPDLAKYDAEKGEIGGYSNAAIDSRFMVKQFIDHDGEVNRARYMPQNPSMVATMSSNGNGYIFDCTKHPLQSRGSPRPDIVLHHHTEEGFALSWNKFKAGTLATGAADNTVAFWNIKNYRKSKPLLPISVLRTHTDMVNHVEWHNFHPSILGSVSDDKKVHIHDTRVNGSSTVPAIESRGGHTGAINCLSFNPANENFLATGSADRTIVLWDLRHMSVPLHSMANGHADNINSISWSPHFETVLASVSSDRRVMIWDTALVGAEQTPEERDQGPPELLFVHGGHTESVSDVAWNPYLPWVLASVSNDNHLHIFRPADTIVGSRED